jgi:hypothetical protein
MKRFGIVTAAAVVWSLGAAFGPTPVGAQQTITDKDGTRLLTIGKSEPNRIRRASDDKVVASIEEATNCFFILDAEGKRAFLVAGGFVYPADEKRVRCATVDGADIRTGDRGKIAMNYRHPDFCPTAAENRVYRVEGAELTAAQVLAVLTVLRPKIFEVSKEEAERQIKAYQEAEAESDKAFANVLTGKFEVLNSSVKDWGGGLTTITKGKDGFHYIDLQLKGGKLAGIGVKSPSKEGYPELWTAFAPEGAVALAVYEIKGGKLTGKWVPINAAKDGSAVLGSESLEGPESLDGEFKITEAKAPNGGAAYAGTVTIKPFKSEENSSDLESLYTVTWNVGGVKIAGVGAKVKVAEGKYVLLAASGTKGEFAVGHVGCESATNCKGIDFLTSKGLAGYIVWTRQND